MARSILIVDDDPVQRRLLSAMAEKAGFQAATASGGEEALGRAGEGFAAIVLDLMMPGLGGLDVLEALAREPHPPPVIVQTAQGSIETAVAAMRAGAFDFVVKPVSPDRLAAALSRAVRLGEQERQVRRHAPERAGGFAEVVAASPSMAGVARLAAKAAATDIPVLIEGESGVGKELLARAIRDASPRRAKPFVTVNCGAIPENLVESILFGHEKGAFTGATERHVGKFAEADGGTLFLDEIGDLPLAAQVKLLRALQEGEIEPVGARGSLRVDVRLVSATNRDLSRLVAEGRFREDLYYRVNVFPVSIPPLRQRREDVGPLARHFVARFAAQTGHEVEAIAPDAMALLSRHDWPGNVRQLENAVFRAVVLGDGPVLSADAFAHVRAQLGEIEEWVEALSDPAPAPSRPVAAPAGADAQPFGPTGPDGEVVSLAAMEERLIRFAIAHYDGRMSEVARRLGIGRSTLYRKLKELGIDGGGDEQEAVRSRAG